MSLNYQRVKFFAMKSVLISNKINALDYDIKLRETFLAYSVYTDKGYKKFISVL